LVGAFTITVPGACASEIHRARGNPSNACAITILAVDLLGIVLVALTVHINHIRAFRVARACVITALWIKEASA
jgi:hypothetical protein